LGVVHEAVQVDLGRTVALKVLEAEAMSEKAQSRFRAEARTIAQLSHQNLVRVHDFGSCRDGRLFYAMDLLDGETLATRLSREHQLPVSAVIDFGIQACRALEVAHAAGVVHRDLKPANLFVTQTGTLKVLDFGVAKTSATQEASDAAAHPGALLLDGTPEYMAPEQARGAADARSDLYALGSVLYELVSGLLPFDAAGPLEILAQKSGRAPRPSERVPGLRVPRALEILLERALEADPEKRVSSATEFGQALEALLAPPRSRTLFRRRLAHLMLGSALFAGAAGLANFGMRNTRASAFLHAEAESAGTRIVAFAERVQARRAALLAARNKAVESPLPAQDVSAKAGHALSAAEDTPPAAVAGANESEPSAAVDAVAANSDDLDQRDEAIIGSKPSSAERAAPPADVAAALADAKTAQDKGRDLRALDILRRAVEHHADSSELLAAYGQALQKNRSWGDALRVGRRRVELDPSPEARLDLAHLERATGHRERAIALLQELSKDEAVGAEARDLLKGLTGVSRVALSE
jgi:serine/threonine-protein kinase